MATAAKSSKRQLRKRKTDEQAVATLALVSVTESAQRSHIEERVLGPFKRLREPLWPTPIERVRQRPSVILRILRPGHCHWLDDGLGMSPSRPIALPSSV
jgi:hypothetical protein